MYNQCKTAGGRPGFKNFGSQQFGHFAQARGGRGPWNGGFRRPKFNVPVNISETTSSYKVHVYALRFDKENIKLSVNDGTLYISGTREVDEANLPNFIRQEYPIRSFERAIMLNNEVDSAGITARQQDGVLIITLPKTEAAQQPAQEIKVD